jgi:UDP-N-acetylglucosamine transferase subunit ALG13
MARSKIIEKRCKAKRILENKCESYRALINEDAVVIDAGFGHTTIQTALRENQGVIILNDCDYLSVGEEIQRRVRDTLADATAVITFSDIEGLKVFRNYLTNLIEEWEEE